MTATINENAYNTFLEPHIGWVFEVTKVTNKKVYFKMDIGFGNFTVENHYKQIFDIKQEN